MTLEQFEIIAKLIRSREPVKTAVRLVLVNGMPNVEAAAEVGTSPQSVSNTLARFRAADREIRVAYKVKKS
jgi:DNA-directed RNA polymerase specialized sigma24 family protein